MKITVNQLDEKNTDLVVQELKTENKQLHQLVNKYQKSKTANRMSVSCQTEEVGFGYIARYILTMITWIQFSYSCMYVDSYIWLATTHSYMTRHIARYRNACMYRNAYAHPFLYIHALQECMYVYIVMHVHTAKLLFSKNFLINNLKIFKIGYRWLFTDTYCISSVVCGHHICKDMWTSEIREELTC